MILISFYFSFQTVLHWNASGLGWPMAPRLPQSTTSPKINPRWRWLEAKNMEIGNPLSTWVPFLSLTHNPLLLTSHQQWKNPIRKSLHGYAKTETIPGISRGASTRYFQTLRTFYFCHDGPPVLKADAVLLYQHFVKVWFGGSIRMG